MSLTIKSGRGELASCLIAALLLVGCGGRMPAGNPNLAKKAKGGFYIPINPPLGGASFNIGPWPNLLQCNDMDGSFMFAHPDACHRTGLKKDCGIIGNGMAFSKGAAYPAAKMIPGGCFQSSLEAPMSGRHFLEYHSLPTPGGSAPACGEFPKYKALADADPVHYQVATARKGCGGPCWPVGWDNACE